MGMLVIRETKTNKQLLEKKYDHLLFVFNENILNKMMVEHEDKTGTKTVV